jgi:uncharacterized protein (TIGR02145 family)
MEYPLFKIKQSSARSNIMNTVIRSFILIGISAIILFSINCSNPVESLKPVFGQPVTDIEGNVYQTVVIGTQTWMAENLKTTKYNDGTSIPLFTAATPMANFTSPGYCWYNNEPATYRNPYGALYNWYAVNTGKLAPIGWHVPTDSDWTVLTTNLGGLSVAGGKLKETGTTHWQTPNDGATNSSGFSAIAGGYCGNSGDFYSGGINVFGDWWSSTADVNIVGNAFDRSMHSLSAEVTSATGPKSTLYSLRCVRD